MGAPELLPENKAILSKRLIDLLLKEPINWKDEQRIKSVEAHYNRYKTITRKQLKSIQHFCRVYDVRDTNSVKFIIE